MKRIRKWLALAAYSVVLVVVPLVYNASITSTAVQPAVHLVCDTTGGGTGGC